MIYFVRSGQYVKIGVADNPWNRLSDFQIGSPVKLELLAVAPGEFEEEARYHKDFAYCHHQGEWYVEDELIRVTVEAIKAHYPRLQSRAEVSQLHRASMGKRKNRRPVGLSPVDAVRVVTNTAVTMCNYEPAIDVRSVTESRRGPGILIWIPGYVSNGDTIIVANAGREGAAVEEAAPTPPQEPT